ncbi:hypothetical protein C8F01DRAFT_1142703, partial [Mycena amicta]
KVIQRVQDVFLLLPAPLARRIVLAQIHETLDDFILQLGTGRLAFNSSQIAYQRLFAEVFPYGRTSIHVQKAQESLRSICKKPPIDHIRYPVENRLRPGRRIMEAVR